MPRRASAAPAAAPAPAAIPEKHELPKKPKPPKQVKDAAENERRAAVHAAALKDWEQQMAEHAERMATRKKAQKDASRPADDSERRVKQRRESWTQAETDAAGADDRRTAKRLEAQRVRVRQAQVDLIHALRSCITNYSDDKLYAQARRDLGRIVYQLHYEQSADGTAGIQNGNPPDGTVDWDAEFDAAADAAPRANVCVLRLRSRAVRPCGNARHWSSFRSNGSLQTATVHRDGTSRSMHIPLQMDRLQ